MEQTTFVIGRETPQGNYLFLAKVDDKMQWVNQLMLQQVFSDLIQFDDEDDAIEYVQLCNEEDEDKSIIKLFDYPRIFVAPFVTEINYTIDVADDARHEIITDQKEIV